MLVAVQKGWGRRRDRLWGAGVGEGLCTVNLSPRA